MQCIVTKIIKMPAHSLFLSRLDSTEISFPAGQICLSPTPIGGATSRYDLDLSPFTRLSRQAEPSGSQDGVTFEDAKLVCEVSIIDK